MSNHSNEGDFKGPIPPLLSSKVGNQDGDYQPISQSSLNAQSPRIFLSSQRGMRDNLQIPSAIEHNQQSSNLSPNFIKLIIVKSLKNNFIKNLINHSYVRQLHQLTQYQIFQLDDLQLEIETTQINKINQILDFINVFTPYSKFLIFWNLFQILTYSIILFWLPFKISFELHHLSELYSENQNLTAEIILMILLTLDICVGMNIAFIHKGQLIKDRQKVIRNYFQKNAFVDLVSFTVAMMQFFVPNLSSKDLEIIMIQVGLCVIFYVLRIRKINKILAQLQEFFNLSDIMNDMVNLMKVLLVIVSVVHNFGCLWHGIAHFNSSFTWLDAYNLRDKQNISKYNVAIYWATMTMTTVGYGDITAKNDLELLINNLTMFIGSIVFAYSVNSIGILVSNIYKGQMEYTKTVSLINKFMVKNQIQFDLQTKIRSYLEYIWKEDQEQNDDQVGDVVSKLSNQLQEELRFQLRGNILRKCKIIVNTFSVSLIKDLMQYMEEQSYSPDERIISINEVDDCSLYIITKGDVELIFEGKNIKEKTKRNSFKNYTRYDSFGELSFFTGKPRTATAISRGFTRVFRIKRLIFLDVMQNYPDDQEKYHAIREQINFGDYTSSLLQCFSCQSNTHMISDCNYVHFCADKEKVIKKEYYPVKQERKKGYSRVKKKNNSRINLTVNQEQAQKYITNIKLKQNQEFDALTQGDCFEEDQEDDEIEENDLQMQNIQSLIDVQPYQEECDLQPLSMMSFQKNTSKTALNTIQTAGFGKQNNKWLEPIVRKGEESPYEQMNSHQIHEAFPSNFSLAQQNQRKARQSISTSKKSPLSTKRPSIDQKFLGNIQSELNIKSITNASNIKSQKSQQVLRTLTIQPNPTQMSSLTSQIQPQSSLQVNQILLDFEKMQIYQFYQPNHNYDQVLKRYDKLQRFFGRKRLFPEYSVFSFFYEAISKGAKLRRIGEQQRAKKSANMLSIQVKKTIWQRSKQGLTRQMEFVND